jgi:hypothetical protein
MLVNLAQAASLTSVIGTRPASCTEGHESFGGVLGAGAAYRLDNGVQRRWSSGAAVAAMAATAVPAALTPPMSIATAVADRKLHTLMQRHRLRQPIR